MNIRPYRHDDLQAVLDINMAAFTPIHESFRRMMGDEIYELAWSDWQESNTADIKSLGTDDADHFHVAASQDRWSDLSISR